MLAAIEMPQWLSDFWAVYGDMITPVLVTLLLSIMSYVAIKLKSDAKLNAKKADLQIQALKEVSNREDNKPQLEEQSKQIEDLKLTIAYLSDMFNVAFQNSNLDPEIKSNLASLVNKIKYGTEDDLVKELEDENEKLKSEIETLSNKLTQVETQPTETTQTQTRMRR